MPVYFARIGKGGPIKIGYSAYPWIRIANIANYYKDDVTLMSVVPGTPYEEYHTYQARFADDRIPGRGELFNASPALLTYIKSRALKNPVTHKYRTRAESLCGRALYMTPKRIAQAGALLNSGKSGPQVARALKVSTASIYKYWKQAGPGKFVRKKRKA